MPYTYTPSPYYKSPDGQDLVGKLAFITKYTGAFGLGCGIVDSLFISQPKGYIGALGRILHWTGPAIGMSAAFVCTTYIATNIRQKDDSINHALGGAVAGSIVGSWRRSLAAGVAASFVLAAAAVIKKEAALNEYILLLKIPSAQRQTIGASGSDWSLTSEIPGNWTSNPNDNKN